MKDFLKQYLWLIVLIAVAFVGISTFLISSWYQEKQFDKTVANQQSEANRSMQESRNDSGIAANYSIERRAEDAVREKLITPKLDDARRRSANSQSKLETAQKQYEDAKTNIENFNRNVTDNCRELQRLFPDTKFEYCQP